MGRPTISGRVPLEVERRQWRSAARGKRKHRAGGPASSVVLESVYLADDAISQARRVEIEQQADGELRHSQVGEQLGLVRVEDAWYGLEFNDNGKLNEEVEAVGHAHIHAVVDQRHLDL